MLQFSLIDLLSAFVQKVANGLEASSTVRSYEATGRTLVLKFGKFQECSAHTSYKGMNQTPRPQTLAPA